MLNRNVTHVCYVQSMINGVRANFWMLVNQETKRSESNTHKITSSTQVQVCT